MEYMIDKLMNTKVVIFGAGSKGKYAFEYLTENGIHPHYFVDNNREIRSIRIIDSYKRECEFIVNNPEVLFDEDKSNLAVIITTNYSSHSEIKSRLAERGIKCYFYTKDIVTCDLLRHKIGFYNEKLSFCCAADKKNNSMRPLFPYLNTAEETIISFLQGREAILKGINNIGDIEIAKNCKDCVRLHTIKNHISEIGFGLEKINIFNISCYPSICQANCIYCDIPNNLTSDYKLALQSKYPKMITEIIVYLQKNQLLENDCYFQFAPAEITVTPFKDILLEATKNYKSSFATNGFIFEQKIADSIKLNCSKLNVSLDAGTRKTFFIIKKRDLFDKVVENMKNYRKYGREYGWLTFKYNILPGINDNDEDIDGMVKVLKELNLKHLSLSHDYLLPLRTALLGIVKFVNLLDENNFEFNFHVKYFTSEQTKRIITEYYSAELDSKLKEKSINLMNIFNSNNDYNKYRLYVYEVEINELLTCFRKETRFSILCNKNKHKNQMVLAAFQKFGIPPTTPMQISKEVLNELDRSTDIFIIIDSNEISGSKFFEHIEQTKRALYIEKYFYSLVPTKFYLEKTISSEYLEDAYHR